MKLSSPDPDSEDGLTLTTTTYSSLENGRKLRMENQGRVTEYDPQGHIVKVTKDGVLIRGKNNEPPTPAPKKEPLLVKKYTPPTDATTSGWILS
ncbi:MAG: hypothetical protein GXP30_13165, partial [Verrucomicrobia bacterium]|nr:hypothetical protein [Verrucomicrobiota bacterium]